MRARLRTTMGSQRGAAAVEFAIVSMLLIMLFYGIISFGFIFGLKHDLTHAATEGARAGLRAPRGMEEQYARARAEEVLSWNASQEHAVVSTAVVDPCDTTAPAARCIRVTITYAYKDFPVVPPIMGLGVPEQLIGEKEVILEP